MKMRTDSPQPEPGRPDDAPDPTLVVGDLDVLGTAARRLARTRPDSVGDDVAQVLGLIAPRLGGRRAFVFRFDESGDVLGTGVVWREPGAVAQDVPSMLVADWARPPLDRLSSGELVDVADVSELAADHPVRFVTQGGGDAAIALAPVIGGGDLYGVMGVTRELAAPWDDRARRLLAWAADAIGNTLARVEQALEVERSVAWYRDILDRMSELVCRFEMDGTLTFVNSSYAARYGQLPQQIVGTNVFDYVPERFHAESRRRFAELVRDGVPQVDVHATRLDVAGTVGMVEWTDTPITDDEGRVTAVLAVGRDVTARERLSAELARAATTDDLTGLVNRGVLLEELSERLGRGGTDLALLFMDLDDFKAVNDTHGHALGDQVLASVGRRLQRAARDGDIVARFGGDEFLVLADDITREEAAVVAERLLAALAEPIAVGDVTVGVGASIGVVMAPRDTDQSVDVTDLVSDADAAMYAAKHTTGHRVAFADESNRRGGRRGG